MMDTFKYGELELVVKLKTTLQQTEALEKIGQLLKSAFSKNMEWTSFHKEHTSKDYTFSNLIECESGNIQMSYPKGTLCKIKVNSINYSLLNLFEERCWQSDSFDVRDAMIRTKRVKHTIKTLQVKNPVLMEEKQGKKKEIILLKPDSTPEEKEKYLSDLSKKTISTFNYMHGTDYPITHNIFTDVTNVKVAHIIYANQKYVGTRGNFNLKSDDISQEIAQYVLVSGFGNKSALLGSGSTIPLF